MTSEARLFNLFKEDMRRRTISIVLSCIVQFLLFPVSALLYFTTNGPFNSTDAAAHVSEYMILEFLTPLSILIATVGAVICAFASFAYIFNRGAVDFYNSLPYNRIKIFVVRYINGILVYLVPFLLFLVLALPIYAVNVGINGVLTRAFMKLCVVGFLSFMLIYNMFILGTLLSGNYANAGFFAVVISFIAGAGLLALNVYMETFFKTYNSVGVIEHLAERLTLSYYLINMNKLRDVFIPSIIIIAVMLILNYFLFIKRHFENSNQGGIYKLVNAVIRFWLSGLVALFLGLFFCVAGSQHRSVGWLIFGIIFGGIVSHVLINSLLNMGIKDALKEKLSLGICMVACVIFAVIIKYDVFGYDRYMPKSSELKSISFYFRDLDLVLPKERGIFDKSVDEELNTYEYYEIRDKSIKKLDDEAIETMTISDSLDDAYSFAEMAKQDTLRDDEDEIPYANKVRLSANFTFNLKNGSRVSRRYTMYLNSDEEIASFSKLYYSEPFKLSYKKTAMLHEKDKLKRVVFSKQTGATSEAPKTVLSKEKSDIIYDAYRNDLLDMGINEWVLRGPMTGIATLRFIYEVNGKLDMIDVPIMNSFTNTLNALDSFDISGNGSIYDEHKAERIHLFDFYDEKSLDIDKDINNADDISKIMTALKNDYGNDKYLKGDSPYMVDIFFANADVKGCRILDNSEAYATLKELGYIK